MSQPSSDNNTQPLSNLNQSFNHPPIQPRTNEQRLYSNQKKRIRDAGLPPIIGGDGKEYKILIRGDTFLVKYRNEEIFIASGDDRLIVNDGLLYTVGKNNTQTLHPFCNKQIWYSYTVKERISSGQLLSRSLSRSPRGSTRRSRSRSLSRSPRESTRRSSRSRSPRRGGTRKRSKN